mgnify:FL=1
MGERVNVLYLIEWLRAWTETFNDCACCPLSDQCDRRNISYECADDLLEKLKE